MSLLPFKFMAKAYNKRQVNMEKRYFVFYDVGPSKETKSQRSERHVCFDARVCDRVDVTGKHTRQSCVQTLPVPQREGRAFLPSHQGAHL